MLVSLATGHGKAPLQMSLVSDECQKDLVLGLDVEEDSRMPLTLEVSEVIVVVVEVATSRVTGRYGTLGIGIAKVHLRPLYPLCQHLEVLIVQRAVMDNR